MYQTFEAVWQQVGGVLEVTFSHDSAVSAGHDGVAADLKLNLVDPEANVPIKPR